MSYSKELALGVDKWPESPLGRDHFVEGSGRGDWGTL